MMVPNSLLWIAHNIGFLVGAFVLTMLWVLSMHQVCVCPLNQMGTLLLRTSIALGLTLEINILCLHLARRPSASNALYWILISVLSFSVFRIVRSSQQHQAKLWFLYLERIWLGISIAYSLWLITCFILLHLQKGIFDENMFYFAFYFYLILGAIFILVISCKICSTINDSVNQLHHSNSQRTSQRVPSQRASSQRASQQHHDRSGTHRSRDDVDSVSSTFPRSEPMRILLNLSKAKCLVGLTIAVCILVLLFSSIAVFARMYHTITSGRDIDVAPNVDIFHYLFVFTFYVSSIAVHWCSVSTSRLRDGMSPKSPSSPSDSDHNVDSLWTVVRGFCFSTSPSTDSHSQNGGQSKGTALSVKSKGKSNGKSSAKSKERNNGHHLQVRGAGKMIKAPTHESTDGDTDGDSHSKTKSLDIPDLESIISITVKSPSFAMAEEQRAKMSMNTLPPSSMTKEHELSVLGVPLSKINSRGEVLGKRGAARPKRMNHGMGDGAAFSLESGIQVNSPESIKLKDLPPASITALTAVDTGALSPYLPRLDIDGGTSTVLEEVELMLNEVDESITVVVFEFDDVLCTNPDAIHRRTDAEVGVMPLLQKKLCFGGGDRIQSLKRFLRNLVRNERREDDVRCFVFSDYKSAMVLQLLKDIKLLRYFLSAMPDGSGKLLSHIIGCDHMMQYQCEAKRHLIMFKLLKSMQKYHDEILYCGHDEEVVSHLERIKVCKTYLCKTKGLVEADFENMLQTYF